MCQTQSDQINEIAEALAAAQGEMTAAGKNAEAPITKEGRTKRRYADLAAVFEVLRGTLPKHGLAVTQALLPRDDGKVHIRTTVLHKSGQWIASECIMPCDRQGGIQGMGSAITYARRYSLSALVGVVSEEDDDGNGAQGQGRDADSHPSQQRQPRRQEQRPQLPTLTRLNLEGIAADLAYINAEEELEAYWKECRVPESHPDYSKLSALFLSRKKELLAAVPPPAGQSPAPSDGPPVDAQPAAHISLEDARFEFLASNSPEALKTTATRLRISEDNPDYAAILAAYRERMADLCGTGKTIAAGANDGKLTAPQRTSIQATYSGIDRDSRLADISRRVGRAIGSVNDLGFDEARSLIESLHASPPSPSNREAAA